MRFVLFKEEVYFIPGGVLSFEPTQDGFLFASRPHFRHKVFRKGCLTPYQEVILEKRRLNNHLQADQTDLLDTLQRASFQYFFDQSNPENGLVADSTWKGSPCSIAAVGFALACYPVAAERGWISRTEALERSLVTLRFFIEQRPGTRSGSDGLSRLFLPLFGHAQWAARGAV